MDVHKRSTGETKMSEWAKVWKPGMCIRCGLNPQNPTLCCDKCKKAVTIELEKANKNN